VERKKNNTSQMKGLDRIPIKKIERASKILSTGAKVGINYVKYYGERLISSEENARNKLDQSNADDIYNSLTELKGSVLKVAQMLSMEKNLLPQSYVDKFSLSQFSVPPLSGPLVEKTFKKHFGKSPNQLFDTFNMEAANAASIGQVHKATKDGKTLAVKIQYPGVSQSISSDLAMVKPIAQKMFNIGTKDSEMYFKEVESKLLEETNYEIELNNSVEIATSCSHISNLIFPSFYPEWSCDKILTMDWMEGIHFSEFTKTEYSPETANQIGQTLWDFYMFQIHTLKKVHADPHPGNFLISKNNELIVLDFGCTKQIPQDFYTPYFELINKTSLSHPDEFKQKLYELEILHTKDSKEEEEFFTHLFHQVFQLFIKPFEQEYFDFSDKLFFESMSVIAQSLMNNQEIKKYNPNRGSRHFIYLNRAMIGLFNLLHELGATKIKTNLKIH
jgi:predicted unusual protein kinase regulating ubiquinone biosynthesis (AarF/ABC1/UbiB family)